MRHNPFWIICDERAARGTDAREWLRSMPEISEEKALRAALDSVEQNCESAIRLLKGLE